MKKKYQKTIERLDKQFKPKPWLKKPEEEKKVMVYGYVKAKHKEIAKNQIELMINQLKN